MSGASDILNADADHQRGKGSDYCAVHVDVVRAVAELMSEWDNAAYCVSCGVRQRESEHGDEHHSDCKRAALERAIIGESCEKENAK